MKAEWTEVELGDVAAINPRRTERLSPDEPVAFVPMSDLLADQARTTSGERRSYRDVANGYTQFREGDLLAAKITPCWENGKIGRAAIGCQYGAGSTEFHVIRPDPARLDPPYALHLLRQGHVRQRGILRMTGSGGQRRVPETFLSSLRVPLPPLDEQRRIARLLDAAASLQARRQGTIDKLRVLRDALFPHDYSGRRLVALGVLLDRIESGRSPVCEARAVRDGEWGVLKLGAVSFGEYRPVENKAMLPGSHLDERLEVTPGDVLLVRKNTIDLVGASAYVRSTPPRLLLPDLIFRLVPRTDAELRPVYLQAALARPSTRARMASLAGGSAGSMPNISKQRLLTVEIDVPPMAVQLEYERRTEVLHRVLSKARTHLEHLEGLAMSLQHCAFAGAL